MVSLSEAMRKAFPIDEKEIVRTPITPEMRERIGTQLREAHIRHEEEYGES